jgi:hypothetical protein
MEALSTLVGGNVIVPRRPKAIRVRILRDGVALHDTTVQPTYVETEPNGPGCGTCTSARDTEL